MEQEFEMRRGERRSFFCDNKLWNKILKITKDKTSISTYIKQAIIEKMKRDYQE
jgi:ribosomal protein S19